MSGVTVYTTDPCGFCTRTKGLLKSHGVEFEEVNLTRDPDGRVELVRMTGMMTFPQVVANGHLVGGYRELQAAADDGRFEELFAA
jgi:glutaredoxin 3